MTSQHKLGLLLAFLAVVGSFAGLWAVLAVVGVVVFSTARSRA